MVTGDYGLTAESIARRIGIIREAHPRIVTGAELDSMDEAALRDALMGSQGWDDIQRALRAHRRRRNHVRRMCDAPYRDAQRDRTGRARLPAVAHTVAQHSAF